MIVAKEYIKANRAALFDWIVLLSSFLLGFMYPTLSDLVQSNAFFSWILAALLLYMVGAALKDLPLSQRMSFASAKTPPVPYVLFLLVGHWFIMLIAVILAEPAIRTVLRMPPLYEKSTANGTIIVLSTVIATVVSWLVFRTKSNRTRKRVYKEGFLVGLETVADIFLIAGVSIFSFVFWEKGVMAMLGHASMKSFAEIVFLFLFLSVLFLFFYLPLRYLYFIEDRGRGRNRRRLLLIFAFILIKAIFEMIGI